MQKALLEKYKRKLIDLEDRLDGEVHRLVDAIPDEVNSPGELSNVPTHNADRDVELFETDVELLRNEQDVHAKVHEALARIEAGTYGICQRCGRLAPAGRVLPPDARDSLRNFLVGDAGVPLGDAATRAHQRLLREFLAEHLTDGRPLRALELWEDQRW